MAVDITKQGYEEFRIDVDFGANMAADETLVLADCEIEAVDVDGEDALTDVVDDSTLAVITGWESLKAEAGLQVLIKGGDEDVSPYKITFKAVTSEDNKWEKDIFMKIKEI
jgi:hypothetical protein